MNFSDRVAVLGIVPEAAPLNWNDMIFKGLMLKGIYGRLMFETCYKMTVMLQCGLNIAPVITHRFSFDDFEKGFEAIPSGQACKVILDGDQVKNSKFLSAEPATITCCYNVMFHANDRGSYNSEML